MIKAKIVSLLVAGAVGVGGTVAIAKVAWNGDQSLKNSSAQVSEYVKNTNDSMNKAQNIIKIDNEKIQKLEAQNEQLNNENNVQNQTINNLINTNSNLTNAIAKLEGSSNYKHMTIAQKKNTINTLLKDWGYSKSTISVVDSIFDVSQHWFLAAVPQNQETATNNSSKNTVNNSDAKNNNNSNSNTKNNSSNSSSNNNEKVSTVSSTSA